MNTRLSQFLSAENLSQSQLADTLGVARASISHIVAGRNKPGFDFIESMMSHFPALNIEWLINGQGKMYKTPMKPIIGNNSLFETEESGSNDVEVATPLSNSPAQSETNTLEKTQQSASNKRYINKIIVFYSDNTWEEIH